MMPASDKSNEVNLPALLSGLAESALPDISVADICQSAQAVTPGSMFLAGKGISRHGLCFLDEALARGATVVAWEPEENLAAPRLPEGVTGVAVPGLRQAAGLIADRFFGQPSASLKVAGITGTNGKTSSAFFIAQALQGTGSGCGLIGTLGAGQPGAMRAATLTTPDAVGVHRQLAQFRDAGLRHAVMEVSSHALVQGRVNAVRFDTAAFTNLSRDHLDYHGDMTSYAEAKARLFTHFNPRHAVINCADATGERLAATLPEAAHLISVLPADSAAGEGDWLAYTDLDAHEAGITFQVKSSFGSARLYSGLVGGFNAENLLIAMGVLLALGSSFRQSVRALQTVRAPAGRMETFKGSRGPMVIVDFAHSPAALETVLRAARSHLSGRLFVVFGCGGERDPGKRPQMGAVAARLADVVLLTDDNPRKEDPDAIIAAIREGAGSHARVERDRAVAIAAAIAEAADADIVVVAGKGHESYQETATGRHPFSDREVVAGLLQITATEQGAPA